MKSIYNSIVEFIDNLFNWVNDLFDMDTRPRQMIPVNKDQRKQMRNINDDRFEEKLFKMLLIFITMVLLVMAGINLSFRN